MPWLVITGHGSWRPDREHWFKAGKHEVSPEIAQQARAAGFLVLADEPELEEHGSGPLKPDHIKRGIRGAQVARPPAEEDEEPDTEAEVLRHFDCDYCPMGFASQAALDRHLDRSHDPMVPHEEPEPEKPVRVDPPAAVDEAFGPFGVDGGIRPDERPEPDAAAG